jgi:regulator of sirC expression with transglutaminase-like and TPR domain
MVMAREGRGWVNATAIEALLRFARYAELADDQMDLAEGALLIAELAYPGLSHIRYQRQLDKLAGEVQDELGLAGGETLALATAAGRACAERTLAALREVLAGREGFHGNPQEYYEPQNSFLNDVIDRRTGLPITLSVVYIEVARRIGAPLVGVGLPAHFVAKWPLEADEGGDLFIDAFNGGEIMNMAQCRRFVARLMSAHMGGPLIDARWFEPVSARALLTRMLANLKLVYLHEGATVQALEAVDRLVVLRPDLPMELRDRGLLRLACGEPLLAAADIAAYAERAPDAPELGRLRRRLNELTEVRVKLN